GGGHQFKNQTLAIDDKIGTITITPEETADLVAFLNALTDTSLLPEAPTTVPSGRSVLAVKSKPTPAPKLSPILVAGEVTKPITNLLINPHPRGRGYSS